MEEEIKTLNNEIKELEREIRALESDIEDKDSEIKDLKETISEQVYEQENKGNKFPVLIDQIKYDFFIENFKNITLEQLELLVK